MLYSLIPEPPSLGWRSLPPPGQAEGLPPAPALLSGPALSCQAPKSPGLSYVLPGSYDFSQRPLPTTLFQNVSLLYPYLFVLPTKL